MEYRNIDTDYILYFVCKRYYQGELNQDQVYWKLESEGYSKKEIENAIYDYYLIYVRVQKIQVFFVYCVIMMISASLIWYIANNL